LSLLLKDFDDITHLSLYDIVNTPGVAADLSHIPSRAKVSLPKKYYYDDDYREVQYHQMRTMWR
jgi:malate/lactate dehydrogenase